MKTVSSWSTNRAFKAVLVGVLLGLPGGCSSTGPGFIAGTATLPTCGDAPATNLDGTKWYDNGTIGILDAGCPNTTVGDALTVCPLDWAFSQTGNDVSIVVDNEYRIEGRLCGDQLYLRGGWWLPVMDAAAGRCTYADDSAEEVALQTEGNVLTVTSQQLSGTLVVKGSCQVSYSVTFTRR